MSQVTRILNQIEAGDQQAAEELLPLVYEELKKLAAAMRAACGRRLSSVGPGEFRLVV